MYMHPDEYNWVEAFEVLLFKKIYIFKSTD